MIEPGTPGMRPTASSPRRPTVTISNIQFAVLVMLLLGIIGVMLLGILGVGKAANEPKPTWEYKIQGIPDLSFESEMTELGREGWELVHARRARGSLDDAFLYECIFKRAE